MPPTFTIDQDLTLKEYLLAVLFLIRKSKRVKRFALYAIIAVILVQVLVQTGMPKPFDLTWVLIGVFPVFVMLLFYLVALLLLMTLLYVAKPGLFRQATYELTHWGVTRHSDRNGFAKPWREVQRYKESEHFFILFTNSFEFQIIQKNRVSIPFEIDDLRNMLDEQIRRP
ncbi:YcxB family protein [Paraflavitalea pollutisoli]|uniref:YcxB family protein n=1 Tax=Paraflavitalea pollutisoli TaxID=3034143 RepID=UPI0023ECE9E9|nr:YcxB family protein [Paraflavitalea sp. H1-2-19X]